MGPASGPKPRDAARPYQPSSSRAPRTRTMATTVPEVAQDGNAKVKERVVEAERLTKLVPDKVHTWPYLVRLEMLVGTIVMALMTIWSIAVDAPLEEPANPTKTPNPSKAPWYFL